MSNYQYISLGDLKDCFDTTGESSKVNLYAVVVEVKNRSRADELITNLTLRDNSTASCTTCFILSKPLHKFTEMVRKGQIIRMHRAKIGKSVSGDLLLYGKIKSAGFAIVLFSGQSNDCFEPVYCSSMKYTIPSDCEEKITSLRMWFSNFTSLEEPNTSASVPLININNKERLTRTHEIPTNIITHSLNHVALGNYYNFVVQAIAIFIDERNCVVLRCWDTTIPERRIFSLNPESIRAVICRDEGLERIAKERFCDVFMYEEHANFTQNEVKTGDILLLINAHVYYSKNTVAITMHEGGQLFGRSITILADDSDMKRKLLRDIAAFHSKSGEAILTNENIYSNSVDESVPYAFMDTQADTAAESSHKRDGLVKQWMQKVSQEERMRQIHATQLTWIVSYIWNKRQKNSASRRSLILAAKGVQFIVRHTLNHFHNEYEDLFKRFLKLPSERKSDIIEFFLSTYLGSVWEEILIHLPAQEDIQTLDELTTINGRENDNTRKCEITWSLLSNLIPGTVLRLKDWWFNFIPDVTLAHFALLCIKCGLWSTVFPVNLNIARLCPVCFKQGVRNSSLSLQCYLPFKGMPQSAESGTEIFYLLFPIQLLAFFLVDVPEKSSDAAQIWRTGMNESQKEEIGASVQEKMISKYKFALDETIIRKIVGNTMILEVVKLRFADL